MTKCNMDRRKDALKKYYKSPNICKYCEKIIKIRENERVTDVRKKKFCGHSCSASYTNARRTRIKVIRDYTCSCGKKKKSKLSKMCTACYKDLKFNRIFNTPMKKFFINGNARVKYSRVRDLSRQVLEYFGIQKECFICKFDLYVEVCHIKPISSFNDNTLIGIVNGLDNLVYLCTNHHKMMDNGFFEILKG